ncbi:unnamed protein product [Mytilus coruscus]|uniref:Integrase catalytic domain-containing protein n=1 Tax=Mytilus coruscus TaxID=42192 RepID=A0A6J8EP94_MYTCO|nr:unnamed protein product [Mytilus coruscus]
MATLPEQTTKLIAEKFIVHFVMTFGCPFEINTDKGRNFESDLFKTPCDALETAKTKTPVSPVIKWPVKETNRIYAESDDVGQRDYPTVHLLLGLPQYGQNKMTPSAKVQHLISRMQKTHEFAGHHLHTSQLRQKKDYDLRVVEHKYQQGDLVYKGGSTKKVGQSRKLKSLWSEPFLVGSCWPLFYTIRGQKGDSIVHHEVLQRLRHALFKAEGDFGESLDDRDDTIPYGVDYNVQGMFESNEPTINSFVLPQSLCEQTHTETLMTQELEQGSCCEVNHPCNLIEVAVADRSTQRQYSPTKLQNVHQAVKDRGMAIHRASIVYIVPLTTLRNRVYERIHIDTMKSSPAPLFSQEEAKLVDHVKKMAANGYGYFRSETIMMASDFAIYLQKRPKEKPLTNPMVLQVHE